MLLLPAIAAVVVDPASLDDIWVYISYTLVIIISSCSCCCQCTLLIVPEQIVSPTSISTSSCYFVRPDTTWRGRTAGGLVVGFTVETDGILLDQEAVRRPSYRPAASSQVRSSSSARGIVDITDELIDAVW